MDDLRLTPAAHLEHLRRESARFREVLAATDPDAGVPACPAWTAADLLWHLGPGVQGFWADVVAHRPAAPDEREAPPRPPSYDAVLAGFDAAHAALLAELEAVVLHGDPAEEAWSWAEEHTVAFTLRRQALEALVHRVDAEQTAGLPSVLPADLAADGVLEVLDLMYGASPSWGRFTPGDGLARVDLTDTGDTLWVRLGTFTGTDPDSGRSYADEPDLSVVAGPDAGTPDGDVVLRGTAAEVLCRLWQRSGHTRVAWEPVTALGAATQQRLLALLAAPVD